jgi:hypothetical protein
VRSLNILVQARDVASYDDCRGQVRGILRNIRKVPPGKEDDFEMFSNDSLIDSSTPSPGPCASAWRGQFHRAARGGHRHHEHHARLGHGTDARNRHPPRHRREEAQHHGAIHHGSHRAVRSRRRIGVVLGILGGNVLAWFMKLPPVIPVDWIVLGPG